MYLSQTLSLVLVYAMTASYLGVIFFAIIFLAYQNIYYIVWPTVHFGVNITILGSNFYFFAFLYIETGCAVLAAHFCAIKSSIWILGLYFWHFCSDEKISQILLPFECSARGLREDHSQTTFLADHSPPVVGLGTGDRGSNVTANNGLSNDFFLKTFEITTFLGIDFAQNKADYMILSE